MTGSRGHDSATARACDRGARRAENGDRDWRGGLDLARRSRLRVALIEIGTCEIPAAAHELVGAATHLLRGVSNRVHGLVAERQRRARSNTISIERYRRTPDGVLDASGEIIEAATIKERSFTHMILAGAYVRDSLAMRVGAGSMRGARLEGCLIEQSDFARANLDRSTWLGATAFSSSLAGCILTDMCLGNALFVECDLRGADLRSISPPRRGDARRRPVRAM